MTCRSCSAPSNKQIVPRSIKPWVSTSPTDVWEPLSKCACGLRSVPWTWSVSVCEVQKKTPWYQLCEAWTWSVSEGGLSHIRHARRSGIWPLDQELVLLGSIRLRGVSATKAYAPTDRDTRFPVRSAPTRGAWRQRWPSQTGGPRKHATPSTASRSAACLTSIRHDSLRTVRHCLTRMIPGTLVNGGRAHATKRIHRHRGRSGAWSLRCARRRRLSSDCELRRRSRSVATSSSPLWLDTLAYASATTSNDGAVHVAEGMSCATVRLDARSRAHPSGH